MIGRLTVALALLTCSVSAQQQFPGAGGGVSPNSPLPASTSGPGPVFNVKNYGATGDTLNSYNCIKSGFNLNCTDVTFTPADVGKHVSCGNTSTVLDDGSNTITAFVNATNVTISHSAGASPIRCTWGTPDDTAVLAALAAAELSIFSPTQGTLLRTTAAPTLYFPAGSYGLFTTGIAVVNNGVGTTGFTIRGDGIDQTKITWHSTSTNNPGAAGIACNNLSNLRLEGFTLDGGGGKQPNGWAAALFPQCNSTVIRDVKISNFSSTGALLTNAVFAENFTTVGNAGNGIVSQGGGEFYGSSSSNNAGANGNIFVQNVFGMPTGTGFRWVNGLVDECGTPPCVQVQNSTDVHFIGSALFTGLSVDGHSHVNLEGGSAGPFNSDNNLSGLTIATGGMVTASNFRAIASGTGKCINNSGTLRDNGANSCESLWLVQSATSTGTTAVLTVQGFTANANTLCSFGDALEVQGMPIAGYNGYFPAGATTGITAMGTNTIQYTTLGSNLGAAGVGGYAMCRNLQNYTGNLPVAMLNNPIPNTCYVTITPIVNATTYTMCNFRTQSATNITRIMASSQVTTTCATAPIITISDGTVSQTLTLTSAKSSWDSAVDTSTGVGTTIFKPNGTITVKYDVAAASACTTPPTQLAVSYNISPILSN